jgi:hypothetical protein
MKETILIAVISALTSGGVLGFIQFLIKRKDDKEQRAEDKQDDDIKGTLKKLEKDILRTQLLLMILMKPNEKKEILTLAQHYFVDLKGNWYMTDIFDKWLIEKGDSRPEWFKKDEPSL